MHIQLEKYSKYLTKSDPVLASIISIHKIETLELRTNYFVSLVKSVISQQLSTKAASSIFRRLLDKANNDLTATTLSGISYMELSSIGVSKQKCKTLFNISELFTNQPDFFNQISTKSNDEVIQFLTGVSGIGDWTAQMFLIFSLGRFDVLPIKDVGFLRSIQVHYNLKDKPIEEQVYELALQWSPYQSVAALYLWKAIDN